MPKRSRFVATAALLGLLAGPACKSKSSGDDASEIKIGQTMPYSGPASAYGTIGKAQKAFFQMINDNGGINGRKVKLISVDDGYSPPKTVEQTRKLVESEGVAFMFQTLGTATSSAVLKYLDQKKIPLLFVAAGADKFGDHAANPWVMGFQPSYRVESKIYGRHILKENPAAKICVLYQNDDFGKDYVLGLKEALGDQHQSMLVNEASYEVTDPTIDSQIVSLQASGCTTLVTAATPKFAAQTIRKIYDIGWKPVHYLANVSISVAAVFQPAGLEKSKGIITGSYLKDPLDPSFGDDPGLAEWRAFMKKYLPSADTHDTHYVYGYAAAQLLVQVLKQCGNDFSRGNIMKQAVNLQNVELPVAVPGAKIQTGATDHRPFSTMQLARFNGTSFERFGEVLSGD